MEYNRPPFCLRTSASGLETSSSNAALKSPHTPAVAWQHDVRHSLNSRWPHLEGFAANAVLYGGMVGQHHEVLLVRLISLSFQQILHLAARLYLVAENNRPTGTLPEIQDTPDTLLIMV